MRKKNILLSPASMFDNLYLQSLPFFHFFMEKNPNLTALRPRGDEDGLTDWVGGMKKERVVYIMN